MEEQNQNLDVIPEESRSMQYMEITTKEGLKEKLNALKQLAKKEITPELENEFCNLLQNATKLYDDEMKYEVAVFYYEYGSLLLTKLENTSEIFGDLLKKKEENDQQKQQQQSQQEQPKQNKMLEEIPEEDEQSKINSANIQKNNEIQEKSQEKQGEPDSPVVFEDQNVKIVDETPLERKKSSEEIQKKNEETQKAEQLQKPEVKKNMMEEDEEEINNINNSTTGNKNNNNVNNNNKDEENDAADDMQVLYENLYTALRIAEKEYEKIKRTNTDEQIKNSYDLKNVVIFLSDVCKRLGEFENWREKYDDSLDLFKKAKEYLEAVEDTSINRSIAELEFLLGTTELYKENQDEVVSIQHFINAIVILENNLSKICKLPQKKFPDGKTITQKDIDIEHLKPNFMDSQESKEVKEILPTLYNKLEDTILQRDQKPQFQAEQQRMKKQQEEKTAVFQPVDTTKVAVKQLGVLGNAKKRKAVAQPTSEAINNQENLNNSNSNNNQGNEFAKTHNISPSKALQAKLDEQEKQQKEQNKNNSQ